MSSNFAFVDGYEAVARLPDGTMSRTSRGSLALRNWERALWRDAMSKSNRGGLSAQQAEYMKRVFEKKDLPTQYEDVVEDERLRLDAVLTILMLRRTQLVGTTPSPARSAIARLGTELNDSYEHHALAEANHPAAHSGLLLQETTLSPRATQLEPNLQIAVPNEFAVRASVLGPSQDDQTMRSSNPAVWPIKATDLVVVAGHTAVNVGGNCLCLIEPDMILFMENGVRMPWPSRRMQARAGAVLQRYFAHEWETLTTRQADKLTESLREWPPSVTISYFEANIYMCWWLKSVAYLYKLTDDSTNLKILCRFVVEFDKICPTISTPVTDSWTKVMGEVLDIDLRPRTGICGRSPTVTDDAIQVDDEVEYGVATTPATPATTIQQDELQAPREGLDSTQYNGFPKPGAQEVAPTQAALAGIHHSGDQIMRQAKRRSKQRRQLRALAHTNLSSGSANPRSKKLSPNLTRIIKPMGKRDRHRRGVARPVFRSQTRAILEVTEDHTQEPTRTTTRKEDRELKEAIRLSLLAAVQPNNSAIAQGRQAGESGTNAPNSTPEEDVSGEESTEKVTWLKAQELCEPGKDDPDICHAIYEEISSIEADDEDYHEDPK